MKIAAGLLMYKKVNNNLEVFLVHFGGPFWAKKDNGAWHIPKGLQEGDEDLLECAKREFNEETSIVIATPPRRGKQSFIDLGSTKYNDKEVYIWGVEYDLPRDFILKSNLTPQGWPENDCGQFFPIEEAMVKILPAQKVFLERLFVKLLPA